MLKTPFPNPAYQGSNLRFSLRNPGKAELAVYSVTGRLVTKVAAGWFAAGDHSIPWNRTTATGEPLATGVYFLRLQADGQSHTQKLTLAH